MARGAHFMLITYRRTGGVFALLTVATVVLAATVTIAVTVAVAIAIAAAALVVRTVVPPSWRTRSSSSETPWPNKTIDAPVVVATSPARTRNLPRDRNSL
jgi:hypothetical protein